MKIYSNKHHHPSPLFFFGVEGKIPYFTKLTSMKLNKYYLLTSCLAVGSFTHAQVPVKGMVTDEHKEALAYTTVRLLRSDSTFVQGTVTDSIGCYRLENVQKGNYLLSFSSIGYEAKVYPFAVGDTEKVLPVVYLKENSVLLGEVEVKGSSFIRQKDRVLIIPDKQQVKHAFTGYDLLSNLMIPGIDVDRKKGVVATMGGTVTLYIDGRKVDYREVQSLRPRDIEKVEYFDVPTGKYAGDVASINYITRKWKSGGYVSLDANQTIGYLQGDYNAVSKVSHGNTSYTLFAGHTMYDYNEDDNRSTESFVLADRSFTRDEITEADKRKKNQQYAQFNVLNQTGKRTLSAKMSFVHSGMPDNGRKGMLDYSDYYEDVCSSSSTDQKSLAPSLELYGSFRLKDNQRLECSLPVSYTQNTYDRSYQENEYASMTNVDEKLYMLKPSLNYSLSMPHQNTLTVQLMHSHRITSATYAGDNPSWQHLWSGESLLFASYNQRFGKLSMNGRIGMSALQYRLHGHEKTHYISPRGDLSFFYQFSDRQQFGIGAAVGNAYPEINTINTAEQNIDQIHVKRGNPYLDKIKMYMASGSYSLQVGRFNLFGIFMYSSEINTVLPAFSVEGNKLVESYRSDGDYHLLQGGLDLSWKATDALRLKLGGRWQYSKITGQDSQDQNNVYGRLTVNYYWKDFSLNVYGKTQTRLLSGDGVYEWQDGNYGASVSWYHGGWALEAGTNNPFYTHARTRSFLRSDVYRYDREVYSRLNQPTGYVKVAYTFDFGKKTSKDYRNVNTTIDSAILKAE